MPDFTLEDTFQGNVVGVDEVGRGPWAGPVMACAVMIDRTIACPNLIAQLDDSKKLTQANRERIAQSMMKTPNNGFYWALGSATVNEIDSLNILQATKLAMTRALDQLYHLNVAGVLVDGNAPLCLHVPSRCVVRGDQTSCSIAAASIIAKVTRDQLMADLHEKYPVYGWNSNRGYGTKIHQKGLIAHGVTPHHRRSFAPIRALLKA